MTDTSNTITDPLEEARKWARWLSIRWKKHSYDPYVIGEYLVNAGIAVPAWDHESIIPPPVPVAEVDIGDVVRIDFATWGIWGQVLGRGVWANEGLVLRRREGGEDTDDWVVCTNAAVRVLRKADSEDPVVNPDEHEVGETAAVISAHTLDQSTRPWRCSCDTWQSVEGSGSFNEHVARESLRALARWRQEDHGQGQMLTDTCTR